MHPTLQVSVFFVLTAPAARARRAPLDNPKPGASCCAIRMRALGRWLGVACFAVSWVLLALPARAHELAIDQVVLWPDIARRSLRGEVTFDPELTRAKDIAPGPEHVAQALRLLEENLRYEVDGQPLRARYEARELWAPGGATPGDLVVFSAELPPNAGALRVYGGTAFKALAVSVVTASAGGPARARSWLLGRAEWTPSFSLRAPPEAAGWHPGGPEQFAAAPEEQQASAREPEPVPTSRLAWRFVVLGFEHIIPHGLDHVLFVVALVLGTARRWRPIVSSLTLFTLAHTLTLGLGNLAGRHFSPPLVEPVIAISIAIVALDNLRRGRTPAGAASRWRYGVVFCFGLIHGMGFANALSEMQLGSEHLLLGLFSFNLGVELGQLAVVCVLLAALRWIKDPRQLQRYVIFPGSAAIALVGFLFAIERLFAAG